MKGTHIVEKCNHWHEVVEGGSGVKPLVYRQWKLRHVTLVKWVKATASIRTTHCRSIDKMFYLKI